MANVRAQKAVDSIFVGPVYENMREVFKLSHLHCDLLLRPSMQKNVLVVEVSCWYLDRDGNRIVPLRYENRYPNATTQSLDAFLYSVTQRVLLMAEQWAEAIHGEKEHS